MFPRARLYEKARIASRMAASEFSMPVKSLRTMDITPGTFGCEGSSDFCITTKNIRGTWSPSSAMAPFGKTTVSLGRFYKANNRWSTYAIVLWALKHQHRNHQQHTEQSPKC